MIKKELPGLRYTAFRINCPTHWTFEQTIYRVQRLMDNKSFQISDRIIGEDGTYSIKSLSKKGILASKDTAIPI